VAEEWSVRDSTVEERVTATPAPLTVPRPTLPKPASTWELSLAIWDLEDRPEALQNETTVNSMTLSEVIAFKEHFVLQAKKEGKGEAAFGRDRKLPVKKFKAEEDDCATILHAARFERGPTTELPTYWDKVPVRLANTFRHLPLEHAGADNDVNDCVVARAHDRSLPLRIRMFCKGNETKKGFSSSSGEGKEPADSWDYPR